MAVYKFGINALSGLINVSAYFFSINLLIANMPSTPLLLPQH